MVSAFSHFTGRNSTVPPKGIPSIRSLEPLICPWEVLVIAGPSHPPKEKYFLSGPQHPPKVKYSLTADIAMLKELTRMAAHILSEMLPRMDWNAEDKLAVWIFFRERLEQYFMIAGTHQAAKVTHIFEEPNIRR